MLTNEVKIRGVDSYDTANLLSNMAYSQFKIVADDDEVYAFAQWLLSVAEVQPDIATTRELEHRVILRILRLMDAEIGDTSREMSKAQVIQHAFAQRIREKLLKTA